MRQQEEFVEVQVAGGRTSVACRRGRYRSHHRLRIDAAQIAEPFVELVGWIRRIAQIDEKAIDGRMRRQQRVGGGSRMRDLQRCGREDLLEAAAQIAIGGDDQDGPGGLGTGRCGGHDVLFPGLRGCG